MTDFLIYSTQLTPRLDFVLQLIFKDLLGITFRVTTRQEEFVDYQGPKLSYTEKAFGEELHLFSNRLLFEKGLRDQEINVFDFENTKAFFGTHTRYALPFDLFAATFYLVTRYEEYLPHIQDEHQRFIPSESIAKQKGFLLQPVVNIWVEKFKLILQRRFPAIQFKKQSFRYISTIDVDSAFSYAEKGIMRSGGGILKSISHFDIAGIFTRLKVLAGMEPDPFNTFSYQIEMIKKYHAEMIYFILLGDYGVNDKNISFESSRFQEIIRLVSDYAKVGIHPSYASFQSVDLLKKEVKRLADIIKQDVRYSRQHFLRMSLPETYHRLVELEIYEDHTMGYASEVGFRAGICTPFHFFDLDSEKETALTIYPFAVMDGTLKDALKLSIPEAIQLTHTLADEVKRVNGCFITLWHNHSLDESGEWRGWRQVYEDTLAYATRLKGKD